MKVLMIPEGQNNNGNNSKVKMRDKLIPGSIPNPNDTMKKKKSNSQNSSEDVINNMIQRGRMF